MEFVSLLEWVKTELIQGRSQIRFWSLLGFLSRPSASDHDRWGANSTRLWELQRRRWWRDNCTWVTRFLLFYQFRLSGVSQEMTDCFICVHAEPNVQWWTTVSGSDPLLKEGRFWYLHHIQRINTWEGFASRDNAPPASVPGSSAVRSMSSSSAGERSGVCHPAERVNAPRSAGLQSSHLRAQRRAGEIGSDTAHPGDSLSEDLWEVDVLHPCRLSVFLVPVRPASPQANCSALLPVSSELGSGCVLIHPISLLSCTSVSRGQDLMAAAQFDPFQEFSSGVLSGLYFPCVIVICALMMTINRSLIIPRFLLIQWLIRAR